MQGLAPAALDASSTEAVNGSQLYATNQQIADLRRSLDNGALGLVQQNPTTRTLTVGAQTDGTLVDFANSSGAARTLTNVNAGQMAPGSTDAVNGGQVSAIANSVAQNLGGGSTVNPDGTVGAPTYRVDGTAYNDVGSAVAALDNTGVKYDVNPATGGRANSITLQGGDPNQPVVTHNVATGQPAEVRRIIQPFADWTLICDENLKLWTRVCNVAQTIDESDGRLAFSWSLAATQKGAPVFILRAPLAGATDRAVTIDFGAGIARSRVVLTACDTTLCICYLPATRDMLRRISARRQVSMAFVDLAGHRIVLQTSLEGLAAAVAGLK